ncbi:hypothetical protein [Nonomuraea jabiensis]|uniref:DUF4279 domain-containing protein n=1 Tax=Nonomuraea jabiensis TaxID=882448 RepID=A0A7W9G3W1_9ACTN|nr:hypothetical protein [Nonomuraea jabiensis]MBB5776764.1 hypothetical protein [Nonomuraea jabiensis]
MRIEHSATLRIMSDVHSPIEISEALGVRPSAVTHTGDWELEASAHGNEASLEELIRAVTDPLLGLADKLASLASQGATIELHLTRDLLGPGAGALCFMLDAPVIKLLGEVGAEVWIDEYDEVEWERNAHTPSA